MWSLAGAVRATDRLSVGGSVNFYGGEWQDRSDINEYPGIQGPPDFLSSARTDRISGHSLSLGLLLAYSSVSVGAVYHGTLQGDFAETDSARSSLTEPREFRSPAGAELRFPRSIGVGAAWRPRPLLRLALDLTYDEWTQFLVVDTHASPEIVASAHNGLPPALSGTRDTVSVNAGI